MKTLTLLRHAKSGWDDPLLRDFDRPLNAKGQRAAVTVGRNLRAMDLHFDHVVASPAVRVEETLAQVAHGYGAELSPSYDRRLYLAEVATLLEVIHALPAGAASALLAGHNPGLEELVLALVPELEVQTVETSCCGMAGAFGYEAAHYDVSMRMAEARLMPAVRSVEPGTLIVADGTSCRHQIRDLSAREAIHVARVLERALA